MTPFARLLGYFSRYRKPLILGALSVVGSVGFSLVKPSVVGSAVDTLTREFTKTTLLQFGLLYVGAAAIQGVFLFMQRWILITMSRRMEYDMRGDFFDHLQSLPPRFHDSQRTGDLMSRATNDLGNVRMLIGPAVMHSLSSILVVTGSFVMMWRIDHRLATVGLIAIPLVAGLVKLFGDRMHDRSKEVQDHFGELSARVQENIAGVRVVRAFGREANEESMFRAMNRELVDRNRRLITLTAIFYPALHATIGMLFVIVFYFGGHRIVAGTMSIGDFVAFQFYLGRMVWPLIAIGWVINLFQRGMASMARLSEILDVRPDLEPEASESFGPIRGEIEFRGLEFAYEERPVLRGIDLRIEAGQTVGIVGRTGSGKSTLLALLSRLYDAPPGMIFVGGRPIESIPRSELRDVIGIVPQETFLFSDSIAGNIRFGRSSATDSEVGEVADLAGLSSDILSFPKGLETIVGERGITLSGGQKQRAAIARALVRNPPVLMLDDALSAVDTATEERILSALREIRRGRTVIVVAHRVSSVKDADLIIVLDEGRIVERGDHETLVALDGAYAALYRKQTLEEEIEEIA